MIRWTTIGWTTIGSATSDPSNSPVGRLLLHPGETLSGWAHGLWHLVASVLVQAGTAAVAVMVAVGVTWALVRRRREGTLATGARIVTIHVPPEVERAGAETLWANLVELHRPAWSRLTQGQPHLAFELAWSADGLRIGLWVPGPVPPGLVERAVGAAWPGARTEVTAALPPLPAQGVKIRARPWEASCAWLAPNGSRCARITTPTPCGPCSERPAASARGSGRPCRCWPARSPPAASPAAAGRPRLCALGCR